MSGTPHGDWFSLVDSGRRATQGRHRATAGPREGHRSQPSGMGSPNVAAFPPCQSMTLQRGYGLRPLVVAGVVAGASMNAHSRSTTPYPELDDIEMHGPMDEWGFLLKT